jgi:hypothetical protein
MQLALWRNTAGDTATYTYDPFGKIHTYDTDASDPVYFGQTMLGRTWEYDAAGNPTSHLTRDASGGLINSMENVSGNWQDPIYFHEGSYVYAQTDTSSAVVQRRQFTLSGYLFASEGEAFYKNDQNIYNPNNPFVSNWHDRPDMSSLYLVSAPLEANLDVRDIYEGFDPDMIRAPGFGGFVSGSEGQKGFFPSFADAEWFTDYIMFPELICYLVEADVHKIALQVIDAGIMQDAVTVGKEFGKTGTLIGGAFAAGYLIGTLLRDTKWSGQGGSQGGGGGSNRQSSSNYINPWYGHGPSDDFLGGGSKTHHPSEPEGEGIIAF